MVGGGHIGAAGDRLGLPRRTSNCMNERINGRTQLESCWVSGEKLCASQPPPPPPKGRKTQFNLHKSQTGTVAVTLDWLGSGDATVGAGHSGGALKVLKRATNTLVLDMDALVLGPTPDFWSLLWFTFTHASQAQKQLEIVLLICAALSAVHLFWVLLILFIAI